MSRQVVGIHHAMATTEQVDAAHEAGQLAHAWTANTAPMMAAVLDAGVDAIVTNFPEALRKAIDFRLAKCHTVLQSPHARHEGDLEHRTETDEL